MGDRLQLTEVAWGSREGIHDERMATRTPSGTWWGIAALRRQAGYRTMMWLAESTCSDNAIDVKVPPELLFPSGIAEPGKVEFDGERTLAQRLTFLPILCDISVVDGLIIVTTSLVQDERPASYVQPEGDLNPFLSTL